MIRGQWPAVIVGLALIALAVALGGCGSGSGIGGGNPPPPPPPPPAAGTATIDGVVVDSQVPTVAIPGAQVVVAADAAADAPAAVTDGAGRFKLQKLAAGGVQLDVTFPSTGAYQAMRVTVDTAQKTTTFVTIAALRDEASTPTSLALSPTQAQVDVGGEVQFTAQVQSYGVPMNVTPSFSLIGDVGTLTASGLFRAAKVGTGNITAFFPGATADATVRVTAPAAPRLGTLSVSPGSLPAEGGNVYISLSTTDGDGIAGALAEITTLGRPTIPRALILESGSPKDGSWATIYPVPANSNPIGTDGVQLEQRYSARVRVTDNSGASSTTQWADFTVAGLEPP
ncbi:MAG: hypothetical protein FJX74_15835, partial [Armatimonadetes bacterium]|nr:hypothetical protein [Armatimonadota bacterium]